MPLSSKLHSPQDLYRFLLLFLFTQLLLICGLVYGFHLFDGRSLIPTLTLILFFDGVVLVLFRKMAHMNHDILTLTLQAEQCQHMKKEMNAYRRHRHDMKNHLAVLHELAREGACSELQTYVQQYTDAILNRSLIQVETGTEEIDILLLSKMEFARLHDIAVEFTGGLPWKVRPKRIPDIISILGNVLDNALEAAGSVEDSGNRVVIVHLSEDPLDYVAVVTNTFPVSNQPNLQQLFSEGYSQKAPDRGRGLTIVRELVRRLEGEVHVDLYQEQFFQVKLELPKHTVA